MFYNSLILFIVTERQTRRNNTPF